MYLNDNNAIYFDSFGVEHLPKEIKKFIENKNVVTNSYRAQAYGPIKYRHFCIGFVDFMLKGKSLVIIQIYFLLMITKRMIK